MANAFARKKNSVSMRLPKSDVEMIDQAAELRGCSREEFVRDVIVRHAEVVVMESQMIRLSPEDFAEFLKELSDPPSPVPEMVELFKRPAPWEPGYEPRR